MNDGALRGIRVKLVKAIKAGKAAPEAKVAHSADAIRAKKPKISSKTSPKSKPASEKEPTVSKTSTEWTEKEDDKLLDLILCGEADQDIYGVAAALKREPLSVLNRIRDSDLSAMMGFEFGAQSDEEGEFFGLALAGVPFQMVLSWCTAAEDRPTGAQLQQAMRRPDLRAGMTLVRDLGLWFTSAAQAPSLQQLCLLPLGAVAAALQIVSERFDALTPETVLRQAQQSSSGSGVEKPYPWATQGTTQSITSTAGSYPYAKPSKTKTYRRRKSSGSGSGASFKTYSTSTKRYWGKRKTSAPKF